VLEAGSPWPMLEAAFEAEQATRFEAEIAKVLRELADRSPPSRNWMRARAPGFQTVIARPGNRPLSVAGLTGHQASGGG